MSRKRKELPIISNLEITDVAAEGNAIGRLSDGGMVVFIPFGAPGDIADVKIDKKRKTYAQGHIEGDTSSRNHLYILNVLVAKLHDRSLTEVFLYLGHGSLKGLQLTLVGVQGSFLYFVFLCHIFLMFYDLVTIKTAWYE